MYILSSRSPTLKVGDKVTLTCQDTEEGKHEGINKIMTTEEKKTGRNTRNTGGRTGAASPGSGAKRHRKARIRDRASLSGGLPDVGQGLRFRDTL